jgi:hypothetical protein
MRRKTALALVATLMVLAGASFLVYRLANRPRTRASSGAADLGTLAFTNAASSQGSASQAVHKVNRSAVPRVNPYAVVRHGICVPSNVPNQEDASRKKWEALLKDPVWQAIFSGVNPEEFSLVETSLPLHRYVTYWKLKDGKAIHWTGKKILIPAGTRVFADRRGDMYLCACGNQVAAVLPPTLHGMVLPPGEEPPMAYLVPPAPEPYPDINLEFPGETLALMAPPEVATPPYNEAELIPPSPPRTTPPAPTGPTTPIVPTTPILLGGSSPPGSGPGSGPPGSGPGSGPPGGGPGSGPPGPPSTPPVTPEPGTFSLILIGLGACIVARRYHMRRQHNR